MGCFAGIFVENSLVQTNSIMKSLPRTFAGAALAASALLLASCGSGTAPKQNVSGNSFAFDPPAKAVSNPSAVRLAVSLKANRLYVIENDKVLLATPAGIGKASSPTPKGTFPIRSKTKFRRRQSNPGAGYPMTYWMSFYSPAYGIHWGFIKPYPCTAGCVRLPLNSARKVFNMVRVGTKVNVADTQPWDATIGASLPRLDDTPLPNPPMSYMKSSKVFQDAEQGKMWTF